MIIKKIGNQRYWMGIFSNKYEDRERWIIASYAHQNFAKAMKDGRYQAITGQDCPDLCFYHVPVPLGKAELIAYHDDSGLIIAGGTINNEPFIDKLMMAIEKVPMRMSHLAKHYKAHEENGMTIVDEYYSDEVTFLPIGKEANRLTEFMTMPTEAERWIMDNMDEETGREIVEEFKKRIANLGEQAKGRLSKMDTTTEVQEETPSGIAELLQKALSPLIELVKAQETELQKMQAQINDLQQGQGDLSKAQKELFTPTASLGDWVKKALSIKPASESTDTVIAPDSNLASRSPIQKNAVPARTGNPLIDELIAGTHGGRNG